MFLKLLRRLFPPSRRAARPTTRPQVEQLEGRALPSATAPTAYHTSVAEAAPVRHAKLSPALNSTQKHRADQLISTFENSTPVLQYGYIENIHDGRGYTAGRAGFTTATGDFLEVVERYTKALPNNGLARYLPRLRKLAAAESESTSGLNGITSAWAKAAKTALFRSVQDDVVDEQYYLPAVKRWRSLKLHTALSLVTLYDTIIQHGEGDDPDGLPALMKRATKRAGGSPATGINEGVWLRAFLTERFNTLSNASDPATREGWRESLDRVRVFKGLVKAGNYDFHGPITYTVYGDKFTLK